MTKRFGPENLYQTTSLHNCRVEYYEEPDEDDPFIRNSRWMALHVNLSRLPERKSSKGKTWLIASASFKVTDVEEQPTDIRVALNVFRPVDKDVNGHRDLVKALVRRLEHDKDLLKDPYSHELVRTFVLLMEKAHYGEYGPIKHAIAGTERFRSTLPLDPDAEENQ